MSGFIEVYQRRKLKRWRFEPATGRVWVWVWANYSWLEMDPETMGRFFQEDPPVGVESWARRLEATLFAHEKMKEDLNAASLDEEESLPEEDGDEDEEDQIPL